ncbi:hypothetical protein [Desulfitobacterium sp.]|uniref:hypothetical protein n=1 Tax=Desulfitobacterium sp. TaxID=49981 RepID=UPI002C8E9E50|nr:hypothetical protein [Desulfitobacterium sp.]HVJ50207.1 hypothetical protein [Desulfitobacterium sp.]
MRMPFRPPTDYYCEELASIDEQICGLLAKRKELSNNNPGFPHLDRISAWSQQYGLNEDMILRLFGYMYSEHQFVPLVEPAGFLKFVPILKSAKIDGVFYAVTHMKQYSNASVVFVETEVNTEEPYLRLGHASFELFISSKYQCRLDSGCGQKKGMQHSFVVIPPLPDEVDGLEFRLTVKPHREVPEIHEVFLTETTVTIK